MNAHRAARWAAASGVAGCLANVLLVLFFTLALPRGEGSPMWWTGSANDVLVAVQFATLVPVALSLRTRIRGIAAATVAGTAAMGAGVLLQILLVVGAVSFDVQVLFVTVAIAGVFGWLFAVSRAALRRGGLPPRLARAGIAVACGFALGVVLAGLSLLLPAGSVAQYVGFGLSGLAGFVPGWLGLPVWTLFLARHLARRPESDPVGTESVPVRLPEERHA
jgi:hypothetical protein